MKGTTQMIENMVRGRLSGQMVGASRGNGAKASKTVRDEGFYYCDFFVDIVWHRQSCIVPEILFTFDLYSMF